MSFMASAALFVWKSDRATRLDRLLAAHRAVRAAVQGRRWITDELNLTPGFDLTDRETVVYCWVSSVNQRTDLASQRDAMERFCLARGLPVDRWITEIGGGMNLTRPKLLALMREVKAGKVATLVVAHKDRLARFGLEYLEHEATVAGCEILVANQESLSPQQEMVQDLLAIVHTFSGRLSGLRRYEKSLKSDDLTGGRR